MAQYGKSEYWEDRYQKDKEPFDWYQRYSGLKDIVTQYVQPSFSVLNVGAGNSRKYTYLKSPSFPSQKLTDTTVSLSLSKKFIDSVLLQVFKLGGFNS